MKIRALLPFLLLVSITCCVVTSINAQISAVRSILLEREAALERLVQKVEQLESSRCGRLAGWDPSSNPCNVASCGNVFPKDRAFKCDAAYGSDRGTCNDCDGMIRSRNTSTVLFSELTSNADAEVQSFLSYGTQFDDQCKAETATVKAWMGVGHFSGASRWFPGSPRGRSSTCAPYDPRLRSWYVAASSGPKDVVLVLDVSGSMAESHCSTCKTRMALMKDAAKALLNSFTWNDYFAVVTFDHESQIITGGGAATLVKATEANKQAARNAIDQLYPRGGTVFQQGLSRAFNIFTSSTEAKTGCASRIILFLTDGVSDDNVDVLNYTAGQQALLGSNKAYIMTFTMSSGASTALPRSIACANQGIHSHVSDGVNPLNAMAQYYRFLAGGLNSTKARWVEPYTDAFGMGRMTTVSRPVYDRSLSSPFFVGVVEIDVPLGELTPFATEEEIIQELNVRSNVCPTYQVTACYLQFLRAEASGECPGIINVSTCRATSALAELTKCTNRTGGINSMLCDSLDFSRMVTASGPKAFSEVACCEGCSASSALPAGAIAGIVVGSVVFVAAIGGGIFVALASSGAGAAVATTTTGTTTTTTVGATVITSTTVGPDSYPQSNLGGPNSFNYNASNNNTSYESSRPYYPQAGFQGGTSPYPTAPHNAAYPQPNYAFAQPVYGQPVPQGYGGNSISGGGASGF